MMRELGNFGASWEEGEGPSTILQTTANMRGLLVVGAWAAWALTADAQSNNQFATQFGPNAQVGATISGNNWNMMQLVS